MIGNVGLHKTYKKILMYMYIMPFANDALPELFTKFLNIATIQHVSLTEHKYSNEMWYKRTLLQCSLSICTRESRCRFFV